MSSTISDDEILRRCQDLVYQVAYAFYDTPYILLLKLMVHFGVKRESELAEVVQLQAGELRKYLGMLHVHRLLKRYSNKEKHPLPEYMIKPGQEERFRARDVIYWYMDYREFANVVKYRIAMMRKQVDDKLNQDVGQRGYICPNCGTTYGVLDVSHLFDPSTNSLICEHCKSEIIEQTADLDGETTGQGQGQEKMQKFNMMTQPIRDALRGIEGLTIPSINIMAWIAQNVKTEIVTLDSEKAGEGGKEGEKKKFTVVIGGEGEKERIGRERLAEQQRVQNALPIWHTHSTVTGAATSLGLTDEEKRKKELLDIEKKRRGSKDQNTAEDEEEALMAHYASLHGTGNAGEEASSPIESTKLEGEVGVKVEEEDEVILVGDNIPTPPVGGSQMNGGALNGSRNEEEEESTDEEDGATPVGDSTTALTAPSGVMVMVGGVAKPVEDVTEDDYDIMSPAEYQAYFEAIDD